MIHLFILISLYFDIVKYEIKMSVGERYLIYVTHVEDTNSSRNPRLNFWAQKEKMALACLESCLELLRDYFETSPPPANFHFLQADHMLCVFIDHVWIRAKLMNSNISAGGYIDVFCVDYGKVRLVHREQIRTLPLLKTREVLFIEEYPPFASRFTLADFVIPKPVLKSSLCYLQEHFTNQYWNALSLGMDGDWERVKLFSGCNNLMVTELIEKGIGLDPSSFESDFSPDETDSPAFGQGKRKLIKMVLIL